jgi:hypothetical protein
LLVQARLSGYLSRQDEAFLMQISLDPPAADGGAGSKKL